MLYSLKYLKKIALLSVLCCGVSVAMADTLPKMAYIDTVRIYTESQSAQKINQRLEAEFAARLSRLSAQEEELNHLAQQIQNESKSSRLSKLKKQQEKLQKQYITLRQQFDADYSLRRNEEFSSLQQRAYSAIMQIRRNKKLDIILDNAVWVDKKYDITDQVIEILNKGE